MTFSRGRSKPKLTIFSGYWSKISLILSKPATRFLKKLTLLLIVIRKNRLSFLLTFCLGCQTSVSLTSKEIWQKILSSELFSQKQTQGLTFSNGKELEKYIVRTKLQNGVKIAFVKKDIANQNQLKIFIEFQFGTPTILEAQDGAFQLMPHLLFQRSFYQKIAAMGGSLEIPQDRFQRLTLGQIPILLSIPKTNAVEGLHFVLAHLTRSHFTLNEYHYQHQNRLNRLKKQYTDPEAMALRKMLTDGPWVWPTLDNEIANLKSTTLGKVKRLIDFFWQTWSGQIVVVGTENYEKIFSVFDHYLGSRIPTTSLPSQTTLPAVPIHENNVPITYQSAALLPDHSSLITLGTVFIPLTAVSHRSSLLILETFLEQKTRINTKNVAFLLRPPPWHLENRYLAIYHHTALQEGLDLDANIDKLKGNFATYQKVSLNEEIIEIIQDRSINHWYDALRGANNIIRLIALFQREDKSLRYWDAIKKEIRGMSDSEITHLLQTFNSQTKIVITKKTSQKIAH